jgi:hypothetical protein
MSSLLEAIDADLIDNNRLAECVIDQLRVERRKPTEQRRGITTREALVALEFEALYVLTCAENLRLGMTLGGEDYVRLRVACRRITTIGEMTR